MFAISIGFAFGRAVYQGKLNWRRISSKKLDADLAEVENHPLYDEHLEEDPDRVHIYKEEAKPKFEEWLAARSDED